jgi:hypothetical protein
VTLYAIRTHLERCVRRQPTNLSGSHGNSLRFN